jgi:hypothetical protein
MTKKTVKSENTVDKVFHMDDETPPPSLSQTHTPTSKILQSLNDSIDIEKNYTKKEWRSILTNCLAKHLSTDNSGKSDSNKGDDKKKREPTKYNNFVKTKMPEIKISHPTSTARERFKIVAELWQAQKQTHPQTQPHFQSQSSNSEDHEETDIIDNYIE